MASATDIYKALQGITYPATKDDILRYAKEHGAASSVIDQLEDMDSDYYHSIDEIYNQFGIETCPPGWVVRDD